MTRYPIIPNSQIILLFETIMGIQQKCQFDDDDDDDDEEDDDDDDDDDDAQHFVSRHVSVKQFPHLQWSLDLFLHERQ